MKSMYLTKDSMSGSRQNGLFPLRLPATLYIKVMCWYQIPLLDFAEWTIDQKIAPQIFYTSSNRNFWLHVFIVSTLKPFDLGASCTLLQYK